MFSSLTAAAASSIIAIVAQDQAALRASPRDSAQQQVVLWQGDALEIRGERMDYLQVYDHRRERAGYIKASQVRLVRTDADAAPESLAVIRFLREAPGSEALGISYTAAYLKAAPANQITPEVFDALGSMADRLARRSTNLSAQLGTASNSKTSKQMEISVAAHLEVASFYGVQFKSFERESRIQVCYDGEAFRRVLAMNASEEQKARAALALTRPECIAPNTRPLEKFAIDNWRADVLDRVDIAKLSEQQKNRLKMRKASVWAAIAYQRARKNEDIQAAGNRAIFELAGVNKEELSDEDKLTYTEAGVRAGSSRWAAESAASINNKSKLRLVSSSGEPGETCIHLIDDKHDIKNPLLKRCTYSVVWANSLRINPQGTAMTIAVQPMESWRELWLLRQNAEGWSVDVIPPANVDPQLGYVEFAGWIPASNKFLVAREARVDGQFKRRFEVINMDSLQAENGADQPSSLSVFYKWQDPIWKSQTLSLR